MRLIEKEDEVKVYYSEGYGGPDTGIVKHAPQDVGDWWYVKIDGKIVGLNPMASGLLKIEVTKKAATKSRGIGEVSG